MKTGRNRLLAGAVLLAGLGALAWAGSAAIHHPAATPADAQTTIRIVRTDLSSTQQVHGTIGYGAVQEVVVPRANEAGDTYTSLPRAGDIVQQGDVLYRVDGLPVPLLYGQIPLYRRLALGVSGSDVRQLETDLLQLGYAAPSQVRANGLFSPALASAVLHWQAALGLAQTGALGLGQAVFWPGPLRITSVHAFVGAPVMAGQPILDVTGTSQEVTVLLDSALLPLIKVGDAVTVTLPNGTSTVQASVADVGSVAVPVSSPDDRVGGDARSAVPLTIHLADPTSIPNLDGGPVNVSITVQTARNVLAVPVSALLALADGRYGIEVLEHQGTRVIPVETGIFDATRVEIRGTAVAEGMLVVVPNP